MKRKVILLLLFGLVFSQLGFAGEGDIIQTVPEGLYAEMVTQKGKIVAKLEFEKVPMTTMNFVGLSEGTLTNTALPKGKPFYDGTLFHRVVPGHVIQAGRPSGSELGGPGYNYPNEIHPALSHDQAGMLGIANGGPHTNGSQFYITLGDRSYLDGDYTVFGHVIMGLDIVKNIVQDDLIETIRIIRVGDKARQFKADDETFKKLVADAEIRVQKEAEIKRKKEEEFIQKNWPDALTTDSGIKYVIVKPGQGRIPEKGARIKVTYTGQLLNGTNFYSSPEEGKPTNIPPEKPFIFEIGKSSVNPGFDEAVQSMKKGEKRIVILPASRAYGIRGFYASEKKGVKRFVISPNTMLVYTVEILE
jgi:peptidylprolyl isomerase